jgi:adenylate cyclase
MVVISLGYIVGSFHYFALKGIFLEMFRPGGAFFFAYLSSMIYKYVAEERDKRFISNAFSHFLDKAVIREILADPSKLKLGGERREVTILFNDIRDFTSISEKIQPEQLSEFLNIHLTEMTNIVFHNGGLLDKYIGDAVVALFGAPVARVDHAKMGAKTALEMVRVVKRIRDQFQGTPMENLRIGVGVNTGIVSVGNMGSSYRFNYTAIGDEMNLGARLEGLNKLYGTNIIVSQSTVKFLDDSFILRELDFVQVKGKSEPVGIYQLFDAEEDLQQEVIELYHQGLIAYCGCDWEMAASKFHQVLKLSANDKPSKLMLDRVLYLKDHPPGKYWSGVWKIESK